MKKTTKKTTEAAVANVTKAVKADKIGAVAGAKKRVVFELNAEPGIEVYVAGTFNNWDPVQKQLVDKNSDGNYRCTMMLAAGTYEYKFYVNNTWCVDPANPNFNQNDLGTLNSVLVV